MNIDEEKKRVVMEIESLQQQLNKIEVVRNQFITEILKRQGILDFLEKMKESSRESTNSHNI